MRTGRRENGEGWRAHLLTKGTKVTYEGAENGTEVVYVTYPHWMKAQQESQHADLLDTFQSV
ncbi:MAG: hypothetical protein ACREXS_07190 [Gammaproteobacteria bacterium]